MKPQQLKEQRKNMTTPDPFTTVEDQKPAEYMNVEQSVQHLLIIRPLKYQSEGFITEFRPEGTDVVFCDVADLDVPDQESGQPGKIYRGNSFLQGYLKGTFKRYLGHTLLGMIYLGPRQRGQKPPFMWQDLSGDPAVKARAMDWMARNQQFLVELSPSTPEAPSGPPRYVAPAATEVASASTQQQRPASTLDSMRTMSMGNGSTATDAPF